LKRFCDRCNFTDFLSYADTTMRGRLVIFTAK